MAEVAGESAARPARGPVSRLAGSLRAMLATVVGVGRTRLELLTVELQLEVRRATSVLLLGAVVLACAAAGFLMVGLAVILAFWDTHRLLAALLVATAYFGVAAICVALIWRRLQAGPRPFEGTLSELARDVEQLRDRGP